MPSKECPTCRGIGRIKMPGPTPPADEMGRRLFDLFTERSLTQSAVGQIIGRKQPTISQWLAGQRKPNYDDLCKIADLFDTTIDYLVGRVPERQSKPKPERWHS